MTFSVWISPVWQLFHPSFIFFLRIDLLLWHDSNIFKKRHISLLFHCLNLTSAIHHLSMCSKASVDHERTRSIFNPSVFRQGSRPRHARAQQSLAGHSLFLSPMKSQRQRFPTGHTKVWSYKIKAVSRCRGRDCGVQSNLRHMEGFHWGQKGDLLRDKIKLKKGERRVEERSRLLNGGLLEAGSIYRAKDNANSKPQTPSGREKKEMWQKMFMPATHSIHLILLQMANLFAH